MGDYFFFFAPEIKNNSVSLPTGLRVYQGGTDQMKHRTHMSLCTVRSSTKYYDSNKGDPNLIERKGLSAKLLLLQKLKG